MKPLTDKQSEILNFVRKYINKKGYSPSYRDISDHFQITIKGAYDHIKAIAFKRYIKLTPRISRGIVLVEADSMQGTSNEWVVKECDLPNCGVKFRTKKNSQRFCSIHCRRVNKELKRQEASELNKKKKLQEAAAVIRMMDQKKKKEESSVKKQADSMIRKSRLLVSPRMKQQP